MSESGKESIGIRSLAAHGLLTCLLHLIEELHGVALRLIGDVDIGAHGRIVTVAGPFHHYIGRYPH